MVDVELACLVASADSALVLYGERSLSSDRTLL